MSLKVLNEGLWEKKYRSKRTKGNNSPYELQGELQENYVKISWDYQKS